MIKNFNEVRLLGNVGRTSELRYTKNNTPVIDFTLATSKKWKTRDGEERQDTAWHKVICWGKTAETVSKIIKTGDLVYVDGEISYRQYDKKEEDGSITPRQVTEIESTRVFRMESPRNESINKE